MEAKEILIKYWGYTNFRLRQEEIINQILDNKDTLALLPTGGGKSICYQIPTLMSDGICLVISPLIALMKNQVDSIRSYSNNPDIAHFFNSTLNSRLVLKPDWLKLLEPVITRPSSNEPSFGVMI